MEQTDILDRIGGIEKFKEALRGMTKCKVDPTAPKPTIKMMGDSLAKKLPLYQDLDRTLQEKAKSLGDVKQKEVEEFSTPEQLIKKTVKLLDEINPRLGQMARKVISGCKTSIQINFRRENDPLNYSSAQTDYDGSRFKITIDARKGDIATPVLLARELVDASIREECQERHNADQEEKQDFSRENASEVVAGLMSAKIAQAYDLTKDQTEQLMLKNYDNIPDYVSSLTADHEFMELIMKECPHIADKAIDEYTDDNFVELVNAINNSTNPKIKEAITSRMEDLANNRAESCQVMQGKIACAVTGLAVIEETAKDPQFIDPVINKLVDSAVDNHEHKLKECLEGSPTYQNGTQPTNDELLTNSINTIENLGETALNINYATYNKIMDENSPEAQMVLERIRQNTNYNSWFNINYNKKDVFQIF